MSTQADRLTKLTSQLVGDIGRLPGVTLDAAGESQLVQLLTDAFEAVGHLALESTLEGDKRPCITANCAIGYPHSHGQDGIYPLEIIAT